MTIEIREEGAHPSAHMLSRLHAGDLSGEERDQVQAHLDTCAACRSLLEDLDRSRAEFEREYDREAFLQRVEEVAARPPEPEAGPAPWWNLVLRPVPLAAGAAVLAGVLVLALWSPPEPQGDSVRLKGGGQLELGYYVMESGGPVVAEPDRRLHPGDHIQFRLTAPAGGYVHILGIDEAGTTSVYFPLPGTQPSRFPGGAGRPVPGSIILDETPGRERVFVLVCQHPLDRSALMGMAGPDSHDLLDSKRLGTAPGTCEQDSLLLRKE